MAAAAICHLPANGNNGYPAEGVDTYLPRVIQPAISTYRKLPLFSFLYYTENKRDPLGHVVGFGSDPNVM